MKKMRLGNIGKNLRNKSLMSPVLSEVRCVPQGSMLGPLLLYPPGGLPSLCPGEGVLGINHAQMCVLKRMT